MNKMNERSRLTYQTRKSENATKMWSRRTLRLLGRSIVTKAPAFRLPSPSLITKISFKITSETWMPRSPLRIGRSS